MYSPAPLRDHLEIYDAEDELYIIQYIINYPLARMRKKPWALFGNDPTYEFYEERQEVMFSFWMTHGALYNDYLDSSKILNGISYWNHPDTWEDHQTRGKCLPVSHLSPFETVDGYAWNGHERAQIKFKSGVVYETAPSIWQIASANTLEGTRFAPFGTSVSRDDVYRVQMKLNRLLAYAQEASKLIPNGCVFIGDMTDDAMKEINLEVDAWCRENPFK